MCFNNKNQGNDDITREDGRSDIVTPDIFVSDNSTPDSSHVTLRE